MISPDPESATPAHAEAPAAEVVPAEAQRTAEAPAHAEAPAAEVVPAAGAQGTAEVAPAAGAPPAPARPAFDLPGAGAIVGRGFDLSLAASRQVRRASVYMGFLLVAVIGPLAAFTAVFAATAPPDIDAIFSDLEPWSASARTAALPGRDAGVWLGAATILGLLAMGALAGVLAIMVEAQILGVAILSGQLVGRPLSLREALVRSRQTFWRVARAAFVVAIPVQGVQLAVSTALADTSIPGEGLTLLATLAGTLVGVPFVYLMTGIVLGDVGSGEAIRRSVRLARTRWRLAVVIALFPAVFSYIELFGLAAGGDLVARVADALGLGFGTDLAHGAVTLIVILAAIAATGSLVLTMSALLAAPQVVAFVGLTHYHAGLDAARAAAPAPSTPAGWVSPVDRPGRVTWISLPMATGILVMAIVALAGTTMLVVS
jgi:hypothetical protein